MTTKELILYEVSSMWFDWLLPTEWAARYIAWKVDRKIKAYNEYQKVKEILESDLSDAQKFVRFCTLRREGK